MSFQLKQAKLTLLWVLPTPLEVFVYGFLTILTFGLSNLTVIRQALAIPAHFNLYHDTLDSISQLVQRLVGERIAGSLSLGIFWGLVGMLVYLGIWLVQNFSTELSNDLAMTKYVVPRGADPESPLKNFLSQTFIRVVTVILLIFYTNLVVRVILGRWFEHYHELLEHWPHRHYLWAALVAALSELVVLHSFVVFTRVLALRKRVLS